MKRTIITAGVLGLGLIGLTAPAIAASERVIVCHGDEGVWAPLEFDVNGIGGHNQHADDIIPPTPKQPDGKNWTNAGKITYIANCAPLPPGETPPVYPEIPPVVVDNPVVDVEQPVVVQHPVEQQPVEQQPVVETPVLTPAVEQPAAVPPAAAPAAAKPAAAQPQTLPASGIPAAAAPVSRGTNQGYNAQTAVGGPESSPAWFGGLGALVAAGAAVALRRRSGSSIAG